MAKKQKKAKTRKYTKRTYSTLGIKKTCSKCKRKGHNKRSCKNKKR